MYNDFNTYMEVDDVITMIRYINSEKKICNGVGMQSHLGTTFPSVSYYTAALQAFVNAGFEVQITELDVTNKSDADQVTWIKGEKPLLFSCLNVPKSSYYNVIQAYKDAGFTGGNQGGNQAGNSQTLPNGWYYIKNINAQKYLQVKDNVGGNGVNVEIGTGTGVKGQKWIFEAC